MRFNYMVVREFVARRYREKGGIHTQKVRTNQCAGGLSVGKEKKFPLPHYYLLDAVRTSLLH